MTSVLWYNGYVSRTGVLCVLFVSPHRNKWTFSRIIKHLNSGTRERSFPDLRWNRQTLDDASGNVATRRLWSGGATMIVNVVGERGGWGGEGGDGVCVGSLWKLKRGRPRLPGSIDTEWRGLDWNVTVVLELYGGGGDFEICTTRLWNAKLPPCDTGRQFILFIHRFRLSNGSEFWTDENVKNRPIQLFIRGSQICHESRSDLGIPGRRHRHGNLASRICARLPYMQFTSTGIFDFCVSNTGQAVRRTSHIICIPTMHPGRATRIHL
jgi:hypothetical protein